MLNSPLFPFQYEGASSGTFTSFAGLPLFLETANACGLIKNIAQNMQFKTQGWSDVQIISSLLLLNIAGGTSIEDIEKLESDPGLNKLLRAQACHGMTRQERRAYERRFRKDNSRSLPSVSVLRRYLNNFHNADEEKKRLQGVAFIPASNTALQSLANINQTFIDFVQRRQVCKVATLDQDATLVPTHKRTSLFCYKKFKAYQPFNTYWSEQGLLLHSEFRDGNVPAGFEQLRLLQESLVKLPQGVEKVKLRSDSAAYQEDLLRYCAEGRDNRFGIIEFSISIKVTASFKSEVKNILEKEWQPIYKTCKDDIRIKTSQEWAEVPFVPTFAGKSKKSPDYRYIVIREALSVQTSLPGVEHTQREFPFQTLSMSNTEYKVSGIVTNRTLDGNKLITWHRERCGDSEKVHSIEKADLAGGQLPSYKFGANAAWWHIMILAFNLKALMQKFIFPKSLSKKRMKGLRFHLINIAGCVVYHARRFVLKVSDDPDVVGLLQFVRDKIIYLSTAPPISQGDI